MKTWLKILIPIIAVIILIFLVLFVLMIIRPFIDYNEEFQYSTTKNILCALQGSKIRHHCEIPCSEYENLEGRIRADCWICGPESRSPEEFCPIMNSISCKPTLEWYKFSMCVPPKLA
jgi:hypothetical protein